MNDNGQAPDDGDFDAWLIAYDEALAGQIPQAPELPPDSAEQLAARECLELLNLRWPHAQAEEESQLGRFRILRTLGRGGCGVVFLAFDPALGRQVALKVPRPDVLFDREFRARFLREAQAAARLRHPNVITIYEAGEAGLVCYLAAAYCPGCNLAEWLSKRTEPVPLRTAAELVAVVARAVHYTHGCGVLHRDLKPGNILLELLKDGPADGGTGEHAVTFGACRLVPQVTDFGLARLQEAAVDLTQTGAVLGTPRYMAPEQAQGHHADIGPATDTYALGCILYELLTGQPPFCGTSPADTVRLLLDCEPDAPSKRRRDVPRDLETVCLKCLEKDPKRRYHSAGALADDLGRWLRGETVLARRVGPFGRGWRWCRRKPVLAGLAFALILAVLGGFAGVLHQWHQAEEARREAEAGNTQTQELLSELLPSGSWAPLEMRSAQRMPSIAALTRAEAHLAGLIQKRPDDTKARVALTNVRGTLAHLWAIQGRLDETETWLEKAVGLWKPLASREPANPEYLDWLATTTFWQATTFNHRGEPHRAVPHVLAAAALWQRLAQQQPGNAALWQKLARTRVDLLALSYPGPLNKQVLSALSEEQVAVGQLLHATPDDPVLRRRMAIVCLSLGELHGTIGSPQEASRHWSQARQHYEWLTRLSPGDPLEALSLAQCCSRLLEQTQPDQDDREIVRLLGEAIDQLAMLARQHPDSSGIRAAQVEAYCTLVACHWRRGRAAEAERTVDRHVRPLIVSENQLPADQKSQVNALTFFLRLTGAFPPEQRTTARKLALQVAALAELAADAPSRDVDGCLQLAIDTLAISGLLNRLGESAESLRQAEQGRRLFEGLRQAFPTVPRYGRGVSDAWERIGKARWSLGQAAEALAAFEQSAAAQREVFAQAPIPMERRVLSRCYDRLAHWGVLAGKREVAAAALREREKLWPDDAQQLMEVSRDFGKLAESVGKGNTVLSADEKIERDRYLAESRRVCRSAEMADKTIQR